MSSELPYTVSQDSITVILKGKAYTTPKGAPNFERLRKAILHEDWEAVKNNLSTSKSLQDWAQGKFTVDGNAVYYDGEPIPNDINQRILNMAGSGSDPTPFFSFWERLKKNPSYRSVTQLYSFLQHEGIPITEDGCILAYKSVRTDYKDHHSGSFDNKPGAVNRMPRNKISDDPQVPCHEGFHVGALSYAQTFGGSGSRIVICKVDPENVVCVPYDHSQQKMRVSEYEVIGNYGCALPSTIYIDKDDLGKSSAPQYEYEEDYEEEEDEELLEQGYEEEGEIEEEPEDNVISIEDHKVEKRKSKKGFAKFDKMQTDDLLKQPISELRRYATHGLQIVGASKIPGGKTALVSAILKVRA